MLDRARESELQRLTAPAPNLEPAPRRDVTLLTVVHGWKADAERWLLSVFTHCHRDFEALIVDNSADTRIAAWLDSRTAERLRVIRLEPVAGFAAAVNAGIEAAAGDVCILFDPGIELTGDAVTPLAATLNDPAVMVAGPYGLRGKPTMKDFEEHPGPDVDAVEGYCMAFRRSDAIAVGGLDPRFRFYRIADIDFSFRLRDHGGRARVVPHLPLRRHEHRLWEATSEQERERLSRRNLYRLLDRWRTRDDLLVGRGATAQ